MKQTVSVTFTLLLAAALHCCAAVNILVLEAVPSPSHHVFISKVSIALAAKGYNVTAVTADVDKFRTENLHYIHLEKMYEILYADDQGLDINFIEYGETNPWSQLGPFYEYSYGACMGLFGSHGWQQLKDYPDDFKFDLVIHDFIVGNCALSILPKFNNPPVVGLTAFNDITRATALLNGILTPSITTHFLFKEFQVNFWDRFNNYAINLFDYAVRQWYISPKIDRLIREHGEMGNVPTAAELGRRHQLLLFNFDLAIDPPEQVPANLIPVGGLQIRPAQPLTDDLEHIMNEAQKGVILFSLGTNVPIAHLGQKRLTDMLNAFAKFPQYTFLCKMELDEFPIALPKNVVVRKWLSQNDILAHKKTKLFITHAGLMSTQESVWWQVPMLGFPTCFDQFLNIEKSIRKGIAEKVIWSELTEAQLTDKIRMMLDDPKYKLNMDVISSLFRDQPVPPLERAIWWLEWTMRHPNATHLQSIGHTFTFWQLHSIDVLFAAFLILSVTIWMMLKLLNLVRSLFDASGRRKMSIASQKKKN